MDAVSKEGLLHRNMMTSPGRPIAQPIGQELVPYLVWPRFPHHPTPSCERAGNSSRRHVAGISRLD